MAGKRPFSRRLIYWFRILCGALAVFSSTWSLLRLAYRSNRVLKDFESELQHQGFPVKQSVAWLPLITYLRLYTSLPWLAGQSGRKSVVDFEELWQSFAMAEKRTEEEVQLANGSKNRKLQEIYITKIFSDNLSWRLQYEEAYAMAAYANSTVLMSDFVIFCREVDAISGNTTIEVLQKALSNFIKNKCISLPKEMESNYLKRATIFPIFPKFFKFNQELAHFYDFHLLQFDGGFYQQLPTWMHAAIKNQLEDIAMPQNNHFKSILKFETLRHYSNALLKTSIAAADLAHEKLLCNTVIKAHGELMLKYKC